MGSVHSKGLGYKKGDSGREMGRLLRWGYKYFEDATKLVRKFQSEDKNVTRFVELVDAEGFSIVTHGCPKCLSLYLAVSNAYEEQYPESKDKSIIVNTPQFYKFVTRMIWPILSEEMRKAIGIYGTDRDDWKKTISQIIDEDRLLSAFGGTLKAY